MFPLVYVWMRQLGAWKLHTYNSIATICVFVHTALPIGIHLESFTIWRS